MQHDKHIVIYWNDPVQRRLSLRYVVLFQFFHEKFSNFQLIKLILQIYDKV